MAVTKKPIPRPNTGKKTVSQELALRELQDTVAEIEKSEKQSEPMRRMTVDLPKSLFFSLKQNALENETTMADILRQILSEKFQK